MNSTEGQIRDKLAENIKIINQEFSLIDREHFIPNSSGTRGFIDLLASKGQQYVIIEIKKSNQTAREAIHELLKYHEGLKRNKGLKDEEIILVIVSTEWRELLIPFSSLVNQSELTILGYKLNIDENGIPTTSELVKPVALTENRLISEAQELRVYETEEDMNNSIEEHQEALRRKGIENYILITLSSPNANRILFPWMIYTAIASLTIEYSRSILATDPEILEEADFCAKDLEERELGTYYENKILGDIFPFPNAEETEISYPAKFKNKILGDEGWKIITILRHGFFSQNSLLSDETILNEIGGGEASQRGHLKKSIQIKNRSALQGMLEALERCLGNDNSKWKNEITFSINEITKKYQDSDYTLSVDLLSPNNLLLSIYYQLTKNKDSDHLYVPHYALTLHNEDGTPVISYIGYLSWNGRKPEFQYILEKYYDGSVFSLMFPMSWGGFEEQDEKIMTDLGFEYETARVEILSDGSSNVSLLNNFRYLSAPQGWTVDGDFNKFLYANVQFVSNLITSISSRYCRPSLLSDD